MKKDSLRIVIQNWNPAYRLGERINEGGFAEIYEIFGVSDTRRTVLKVVDLQEYLDRQNYSPSVKEYWYTTLAEKTRREIECLQMFNNSGMTTKCLDYCTLSQRRDGKPSLFMIVEEYYVNAKDYFSRQSSLNVAEVVSMARDIARTEILLEEKKIVHKDIKPENIFLSNGQKRRFILGDFGIARSLEDSTGKTVITGIGTKNFAPPYTYYKGNTYDFYMIGATLYYMLSGGLSLATVMADNSDPYARLRARKLSPYLIHVIEKATSVDPEKNYQHAMELYNDLTKVLQNRSGNTVVSAHTSGSYGGGSRSRITQMGGNGTNTTNMRSMNMEENDKKKKKILIAGICSGFGVLLVAVIIVCAVAFSGGRSKSSRANVKADASTDTSKEATTVEFERKVTNSNKERASLKGMSPDGNVVWSYDSKSYTVTDMNRISEIGTNKDVYYLAEGGRVKAFDIATGDVIWENKDFAGCLADSTFGDDGTLYLCGGYGPDLFIVDEDGKTVKRIDSVEDGYCEACKIDYYNSFVKIDYKVYPTGEDDTIDVNLDDYSTSVDEERAQKEEEEAAAKAAAEEAAKAAKEQAAKEAAAAAAKAAKEQAEKEAAAEAAKEAKEQAEKEAAAEAAKEAEAKEAQKKAAKMPSTSLMNHVSKATSTTFLNEGSGEYYHSADKLIDGSSATAWTEGTDGQGEGESVTLKLDGEYEISGFYIYNGHEKSQDLYYQNSRPSELLIECSDGTEYNAELDDTMGQQKYVFDEPVYASEVTFVIESVYAGSKWKDTCISEIILF